MKGRGFTLVELLVCIAMLAILVAILVPWLAEAKDRARTVVCMSNLRLVGQGVFQYTACEQQRLPPFAFSDFTNDLALSGHWGGAGQADDPDTFCRLGVQCVNLWTLVQQGQVWPQALLCPAAPQDVLHLGSSYFPRTPRFSTYCLRFPASEDLFRDAPHLADLGGDLLGVYDTAAGGQRVPVGRFHETVPQVRLDRNYRLAGADDYYDVANNAMACDTFWRSDYCLPAGAPQGSQTYAVRWELCHRARFNVLFGTGSVKTVRDDGTIAANSNSSGHEIAKDQWRDCTAAVWRYFDQK